MSHNDWIPTLCCHRGRAGHRRQAQGRLHSQRHQLQSAPRRLRSVSVSDDRERHRRATTTAPRARATVTSTRTTTACSWPMRQGDYKYVFSEQRTQGTMGLWAEPFTTLRLQKIFNVMQDPFERADVTSNTFWDWQMNHVGSMYGVMDDVFQFASTFKDFPPRSFPPSFNPANILEEDARSDQTERGIQGELGPRSNSRWAEQDDRRADAEPSGTISGHLGASGSRGGRSET